MIKRSQLKDFQKNLKNPKNPKFLIKNKIKQQKRNFFFYSFLKLFIPEIKAKVITKKNLVLDLNQLLYNLSI